MCYKKPCEAFLRTGRIEDYLACHEECKISYHKKKASKKYYKNKGFSSK